MLLTAIIPTYNEAEHLERCLLALGSAPVIVVDAESSDSTADIVRKHGKTLISTPFRNRGYQLGLGAEVAKSPFLLFLHADCVLDQRALNYLYQADRAYAFRLQFEPCRPWLCKLNQWGANLRSRYLGLPYGDQGLCISKERFEALGGYPPIKQMEDVMLIEKIRQHMPLELLDIPLLTSSRKYERQGWARTTAKHLRTISDWKLRPRKNAVVYFVKNPELSPVKTRLAKTIGKEKACAVYRLCIEAIVAQARRLQDVSVFFACHEQARNPLIPEEFSCFPQSSGHLGNKMLEAINGLLPHYDKVAVLGSDAPTLPDDHIMQCFSTQEDFVLGPTCDGGYYLLAASKQLSCDALDDVRFSTEHAKMDTQSALQKLGSVAELTEWFDIDEYEDLAHWGDRRIRALLS